MKKVGDRNEASPINSAIQVKLREYFRQKNVTSLPVFLPSFFLLIGKLVLDNDVDREDKPTHHVEDQISHQMA